MIFYPFHFSGAALQKTSLEEPPSFSGIRISKEDHHVHLDKGNYIVDAHEREDYLQAWDEGVSGHPRGLYEGFLELPALDGPKAKYRRIKD